MKYYSLLHQSPMVDFKEATIKGQAPDKGLYFPSSIPEFEKSFVHNLAAYTKEDIALRVIEPYVGTSIPSPILEKIVTETIQFDVPLIPVTPDIYSLEMFHGNTLAFKDMGARFMSRCLGYFVKDNNKKLTVLVATSGDTGGAVADGFYNVDGVEVIILYPSNKVSLVQEKQLTTLGHNIHALEVEGSFDDCQLLVKKAFADKELCQQLFLTSANSINVARWLPQQFFYFFALKQWPYKNIPPVISVPSGNFGNICAGLLAMRSGLPVKHFIAACNANDVVPRFFQTKQYKPEPSIATISNAMDVGDPSNFVRILELFDNNKDQMEKALSAISVSDTQTKVTIQQVYKQWQYLLDPHGAVGCYALQQYVDTHPGTKGIFAETAHPVKFFDVVEPLINKKIPLPPSVENIMNKTKHVTRMKADYTELKDCLLSRSR